MGADEIAVPQRAQHVVLGVEPEERGRCLDRERIHSEGVDVMVQRVLPIALGARALGDGDLALDVQLSRMAAVQRRVGHGASGRSGAPQGSGFNERHTCRATSSSASGAWQRTSAQPVPEGRGRATSTWT